MINGEYRNNNNTLSSDDEISLAVRKLFNYFSNSNFKFSFHPLKKLLQSRISTNYLPTINSNCRICLITATEEVLE
jgi:hypothetical protein